MSANYRSLALVAELRVVLDCVKRQIAYIDWQLEDSDSREMVIEGQGAVAALEEMQSFIEDRITALEARSTRYEDSDTKGGVALEPLTTSPNAHTNKTCI